MSSSISLKQYAGSTILYICLDNRGRSPSLWRNIRQVLRGHERELQRWKASGADNPTLMPPTERIPSRAEFELPDQEVMQAAVTKSAPRMLRVMPRAILRKDIAYAPDELPHTTDPDWLPAPDSMISACHVRCMTYSAEGQKVTSNQSLPGRLITQRDVKDNLKYAIEVDEPFHIDETTFYAPKNPTGKTAGRPRWQDKRFAADKLKLTITFDRLEDAEIFEAEHDCNVKEAQGDAPMLRATWTKLPVCPPDGRLIQAHILHGKTSEPLAGWGFRVDVAWSSPSETALQIVSRTLQSTLEGRITGHVDLVDSTTGQLSDLVPDKNLGRQRVTYQCTDGAYHTRSVSKDSLKCMFCSSRLPLETLDSLRFHYKTCHEYFKIDVSGRDQMPDGTVEDVFTVEMAHPKDGRTRIRDGAGSDIDWVRPRQPFDFRKYLNGDMAWVDHRSRQAKRKRVQRGRSEEEQILRVDVATARSYGPVSPIGFGKRQKTSFEVPNLSGVTFFRTTSKRLVQAGEILEESDDDLDDTWLRYRQIHRQAAFPDDSARRFVMLYNEHIRQEAPLGNMYLRKTMIRFAQKHREVLRDRDMLGLFEKKLDELQIRRSITSNVKGECIAALGSVVKDSTSIEKMDVDD